MTKTTKVEAKWLYHIEILCDPGIGDNLVAHRGIPFLMCDDINEPGPRVISEVNAPLYSQLRLYRERHVGAPADKEGLPEKMVKFIPRDDIRAYDFGQDQYVECAVCWLIQGINQCQVHSCGHLTCKDCWSTWHGEDHVDRPRACPQCRELGVGQRPWADIGDCVEGGFLNVSSDQSGVMDVVPGADHNADVEPAEARPLVQPAAPEEEKKEPDAPGCDPHIASLSRA